MKVRLRLLVGREDGDRDVFVIGALNHEYLMQMPIEDGDRVVKAMKETWTGEPEAYEWREVDCLVPLVPLERAFEPQTVHAEIAPAQNTDSGRDK